INEDIDPRIVDDTTKTNSKGDTVIITTHDDISYDSCFSARHHGENVTKCYHFEKLSSTFNEASEICRSENSTLVTIQDMEENKFLKNKLLYNQIYWIGGIRIIQDYNYFIWSNGEKFDFTHWAESEPKRDNKANCISILNGQWYASDCNEKHSIICEKTKASQKYLKGESGSALLNQHVISLNNARKGLFDLKEAIDKIFSRDAKIINALQKVLDGKIFIKAKEKPKTSSLRRKRSLNTKIMEKSPMLSQIQSEINTLRIVVAFSIILNLILIWLFSGKRNKYY
ncbi:CD209 antigen-like protein A isoform X2, partial [Leptotrombidium deliense]